jgi:hypothetical protein
MPRSVTPLNRYLRIAENTKAYKFDTLVRARDFFRAIPLMKHTGQTSQALANLNRVVDGRHDAEVIAEAFRRMNNIDASTPTDLTEAERVLRTVIRDDRNSGEALTARRLLLDWKRRPIRPSSLPKSPTP